MFCVCVCVFWILRAEADGSPLVFMVLCDVLMETSMLRSSNAEALIQGEDIICGFPHALLQ